MWAGLHLFVVCRGFKRTGWQKARLTLNHSGMGRNIHTSEYVMRRGRAETEVADSCLPVASATAPSEGCL